MAADAIAQVNEYLRRFGTERNLDLPPLDSRGIGQVQRGSAVVSIHAMEEQGVLLVLSKVMDVPTAGREECYRRLLELSLVSTGDAAFAIDEASDAIYLRCLRRLEGLDYGEFEDLVHTVATVADEWDDRLEDEFGS